MNNQEKAKIVAFARLMGVSGTDKEIIERFEKYYNDALTTFQNEPVKMAKAELLRRPF